MLQDISCHYTDQEKTQAHWALEAFKLIYEMRVHSANVENILRQPDILKLSRNRLKNIHQHLQEQIHRYEILLAPLGWKKIDQRQFMSSVALQNGSSFLAQNIDNLFRDWCWGDPENQSARISVQEILKGQDVTSQDDLLVLGSGASRLAYDLHQALPFGKTYAVDYNPLFHLLVKKIIQGESLTLCEFPIVPSTSADFAIDRVLKAPSVVRSGFELVLGDITEESFLWPQARVILTPWLIDVVDMDFSALLSKINHHLPQGGLWVNHGPLGFNNPRLRDYYSLEEVNYLLQKFGFKMVKSSYEYGPYLQSPSSNSHRQERVYSFVVEKVADGPEVEMQKRLPLPEWLQDPQRKIDIPVQTMRLEEAFVFNAKVAHLLKKNLSFHELVDQLNQDIGMEKAHLARVVEHILMNFYQQSLLNPHDH